MIKIDNGVKKSFIFLGTIHPMFFLRKLPMEFFEFHFWSFSLDLLCFDQKFYCVYISIYNIKEEKVVEK